MIAIVYTLSSLQARRNEGKRKLFQVPNQRLVLAEACFLLSAKLWV